MDNRSRPPIGVRDIALVEKTIRAFSLLEALTRSGCPFIFKGGSSLMLHLNTSKRLSIDIDIICPPGTIIEDYLSQYAEEYSFGKVELVERISRTDVPKQHAKFYYEVSYPGNGGQDKILLDVLFEIRHYTPDDIGMLASQALQLPMPTKLNKLKKTHPEAFFYLNEIQRMG